MFCKNCGSQLPDHSAFCLHCGAKLSESSAIAPAPAAPAAPGSISATTVLVLGIVGLALSEGGIPGIIVSAIGRKKAAAYQEQTRQPLSGKAKVGSILAKVGLIVGIAMTAIWLIYGIVYGVIFGLAMSDFFEELPYLFR